MKRFSHSSVDQYELCPRKFQLQRLEKWRSPKLPSPLFFGGALDEAFSHLLCTKKVNLTEEELTLQLTKTPVDIFLENMTHVKDVYKNPVELAQNPNAEYFSSDFTPELLQEKHLGQLQLLEPKYKLVDFLDFHQQCKEQVNAKPRRVLLPDDQILYNYMSWLTLVEKGKLMIDAYKDTVLPQIHRVESIQEKISISNDDGDEITGLIDFRCSFTDNPEQVYTMDNKTSSKAYAADATKESLQLATYCEAKKDPHAGYVVVEKKIYKKSPQIRINIQKDVIPEETLQKTFDRFENTVYNVQAGNFPQNWDSCFAFGRVCEYYRVCKYNDYSGLIKLEQEVPEEIKEEL
jgi:hypothetical protein